MGKGGFVVPFFSRFYSTVTPLLYFVFCVPPPEGGAIFIYFRNFSKMFRKKQERSESSLLEMEGDIHVICYVHKRKDRKTG